MDQKERFLRVYSTLPIGIRREIVAVLPDPIGPISWEAAYVEVESNTEMASKILDLLDQMKVI